LRSCPLAWCSWRCVTAIAGMSRIGQGSRHDTANRVARATGGEWNNHRNGSHWPIVGVCNPFLTKNSQRDCTNYRNTLLPLQSLSTPKAAEALLYGVESQTACAPLNCFGRQPLCEPLFTIRRGRVRQWSRMIATQSVHRSPAQSCSRR
jgi:hypothetical protein